MRRALRIIRETDTYAICLVEADRSLRRYCVLSQAPQTFRTPLEAILAIEATARDSSLDTEALRLCAECLDSYASRGAITREDALYALAALDDAFDHQEAPDLLNGFMERRHAIKEG